MGVRYGPLAVRSDQSRGEAQRATTTGAGRSTGPLVFQPVPWEGRGQLLRGRDAGKHPDRRWGWNDAEAGMPLAEASGAICVQKLDDSRNSAIHIRYRISLRSSSLWEPRYPLLRVVCVVRRPSEGAHTSGQAVVGGLHSPIFRKVNAPPGVARRGPPL